MTVINPLNDKYTLPPGWRWVRLDSLFDVKQGVAMSPSRRLGLSPFPFLRTLNIQWGYVDLFNLDKMDFSDDEVTALNLRKGDLLVCEGGDVGRTAVWRGELDVCLYQNHIHRLRRKDDSIIPDFFALWLQAAFTVYNSYKGTESTTTIPNLSGGNLKSFLVPLPPLSEQKRIVSVLNDQMATIEKARLAAEARLQAAKELTTAYLNGIFNTCDDKKNWRTLKLADVCEDKIGNINPKILQKATFRYIDISSVDNVSKWIIEAKTINCDVAPSRARQIIKKNDVIVSTTRPNLNAVAMVPDDLDGEICSTGFCILRARGEILPEYLYIFTQSNLFVSALSSLVKGALYPAVSDMQVKSLSIPVPASLVEQKNIVCKFNDQVIFINKIKQSLLQQLEVINSLPSTLLRRAFSGGI